MVLARISGQSLSLVLPADAAISVFPAAPDSHYYVYIHTLKPFAQSLGGHREQRFFSTA